MLSPRLSGIAVLGTLALVLSGCVGEEQSIVGVDELRLATLGAVTPSQQAFIDRMDELSEGSVSLDVAENWQPSGGDDVAEVALTKAVLAGDVDVAWVTVRSLTSIGVTGIDALEAPLLIQTHKQQRAVATGVAGEIVRRSLKNFGVEGLAVLPGPFQYPVASAAPLLDISEWAGKTVAVSDTNAVEAATITAFGATPAAAGDSAVADVVDGSAQAGVADPDGLVAGGASAAGPVMTANVALWPQMSIIIINRDVYNRLSSRQHGFVDGSVVRAQDIAMAAPDVATGVAAACVAGARFSTASGDQLTALATAAKPVYAALEKDAKEARLLTAVKDAVKRNAGVPGFGFGAECVWVAPAA